MTSDNKFSSVCQCCLTDQGPMTNMLTEKTRKIKLIERLKCCAGIDLLLLGEKEDDSKNICPKCETNLKISYEFRELCLESQRILSHLINDVKDEPVSGDDEPLILYTKQSKSGSQQQFTQVFVKNIESENTQFEGNPSELVEKTKINFGDEKNISSTSKPEQSKEETSKAPIEKIDVSTMEANYMCYHCDQFLPTHKDYIFHRENHVLENSVIEERQIRRKCYVCQKDVNFYVKHLEDEHKTFRPNTCKLCKMGFHTQLKLREHLYKHVNVNTYNCLGCSRLFKNKTLLRNHILRDQHSKDLYYCLHCGLGCKKFLTLHNHFQAEHSTQYSKQLYPCYKCKKTFSFNKLVFSHDCPGHQTETSDQNFKPSELHKCKGCDKMFSDDDELVCHSFTECEARFKCTVPGCNKVFDHKRGISDHMREGHERQGNFICDQCGFSTNAARKLLVHKAKYHNPKTAANLEIFRCQHVGCEATLRSKYALKTHMRVIHLNRQLYECHLCAKKFRCFSSIQNHMVLNHLSSPENQRRFACNLCDMKFLHEKTQLKHLLSHRDDRRIQCSLCPNTYRSPGNLKDHIRVTHEGTHYECKHCNKTYSAKLKLRDHLFFHRNFKPYNCMMCPSNFIKKYLFIKHLSTHNIQYNESVHGYREKEDLNDYLKSCKKKRLQANSTAGVEAAGCSYLNL